MTHVEMKETRKRRVRADFITLFVLSAVFFMIGFFTHWCVCSTTHENVVKVELSVSPNVFIVKDRLTEEVEETTPVEETVEETETETELAEPVEEEFQSYYTYTDEELDLLSRLIFSEGGTESYETKLKIGSVVMNRVTEDENFPNTIREVIYQKNQFSVTTAKINGVVMIDRPADEESKRAAKEVLDYGSVLPHDVQVFYAKGCKGDWINSREVYGTYDRTVFAYIYPKGGKV